VSFYIQYQVSQFFDLSHIDVTWSERFNKKEKHGQTLFHSQISINQADLFSSGGSFSGNLAVRPTRC